MSTTTVSPENHVVVYGVGGTNQGLVENRKTKWPVVRDMMTTFITSGLTSAQYENSDKARLKAENGFFIGATFKGGSRKRQYLQKRQFITLDIDEGTPLILRRLQTKNVLKCEHVIHSTRSHDDDNDKIKLHVIVPLSRVVDEDEWHAMSRIVASWIDPTMNAIDSVSHRVAQIMYLPCHNKDVTPVAIHHEGPILTPEMVWNRYTGDWQDIATLPKSEREDRIRISSHLAENPLLKRGYVGAWCRTIDIHQCIELLNDMSEDGPVYTMSEMDDLGGEPARYTYEKGTGANGAVVYHHDGIATKLQSNHSSDPATGQTNSFDLMRLHKFGFMDTLAERDKPAAEQKSYKAMIDLIQTDDRFVEVRRAHRDSIYVIDPADGFESLPDEDDDDELDLSDGPGASMALVEGRPEGRVLGATSTRQAPAHPPMSATPPDGRDWKDDLHTNKNDTYKKTLRNLILIIRNVSNTRGRIRYNEFARGIAVAYPIRSKKFGVSTGDLHDLDDRRLLADYHRSAIKHILSGDPVKGGWGLEIPDALLNDALLEVSRMDRFHPIKLWLNDLPTWDGTSRVENLFPATCGVADDAYHRAVGRMLMTGAVARAVEPGCKYDYLIILEGLQGAGKSRFVRDLAPWPDLVGESDGHFDDEKKFVESTMGYLFIELPELAQFSKADVRAIKNTLSKQRSTGVRLSYRRDPEVFPRSCVMIGTTNDDQYLRDNTGHRRYWPVKVEGKVDLGWLAENHRQLWAEAFAIYKEMRRAAPHPADLPFFLAGEAETISLAIQASKVVHDISEDDMQSIQFFFDKKVPAYRAACGYEDSGHEDDGLQDSTPTFRTVTCAREIFDLVFSEGGRISYDPKWAARIGIAMRRLPEWTMHSSGIVCGRYRLPKTYRRNAPS